MLFRLIPARTFKSVASASSAIPAYRYYSLGVRSLFARCRVTRAAVDSTAKAKASSRPAMAERRTASGPRLAASDEAGFRHHGPHRRAGLVARRGRAGKDGDRGDPGGRALGPAIAPSPARPRAGRPRPED